MNRTVGFALMAIAAASAPPATAQHSGAAPEPASHPKEVALVDEEPFGSVYRETTTSVRLYTQDADPPGVSTCVRNCVAAWPPLRAPAGATPVGEWTVVQRPDGIRQWAFRGKPVHMRFHDAPSDATGVGIPGWHVIPYFSKVASEISRASALAATEAMWDVIDANHDGVIDARDRVAQRDVQFARIDSNHDGQLSRDELGVGSPEFRSGNAVDRLAWFARLDTDSSDGLSRTELVKGDAGQLPAESSPRAAALFAMADANHDGEVTRAEFDAIVERQLDQVDANHDGKISYAEHEAGRAMLNRLIERGQPRR